MKALFLLSKEDVSLAESEIRALIEIKGNRRDEYLIGDVRSIKPVMNRLAYTREIHRVLFSCSLSSLQKRIETYSWNEIIIGSFAFSHFDRSQNEVLGGLIYDLLLKPKVKLKNPDHHIVTFIVGKKVYCCEQIEVVDGSFDSRRGKFRNALPITLHPKLARVIVNLSGARKGSRIVDPFCGSGGLLVEGTLIGIKCTGIDIDESMILASNKTMKQFKAKNVTLRVGDAFRIGKVSYVVSDLPYGKNTKSINWDEFYSKFFRVLEKKLTKRAVLGLPASFKYKKHLGKLKEKGSFTHYVHKSLSKRILILET